jgi:hypothetical protein
METMKLSSVSNLIAITKAQGVRRFIVVEGGM